MTLHKEILCQVQWHIITKCCRYVHNDSLGVNISLYAQRHDWGKVFPLGIKAVFAILYQSLHDW